MSWVWCDGNWSDGNHAPVAWRDRGWTHGLGLFETMLALEGVPVFSDRHHRRLADSCAALGWRIDLSSAFSAMVGLLDRNRLAEGGARIRLAVSGGLGGLREPGRASGQCVWMMASGLESTPDVVACGVSLWIRNSCSPLAGMKSASYAENMLILEDANRQGWDEALLFNQNGHLCEAATANVFLVWKGMVRTPALDSGCLPGITRSVVIEEARRLGLVCEEKDLTRADLYAAEEIFLTSSTRGVVGLSSLDGHPLVPGPLTGRIRDAWHEAVLSDLEENRVDP